MTIASSPTSLNASIHSRNDVELLSALKELKNSIIGNTWKKVEVADEEGLLQLYVLFARLWLMSQPARSSEYQKQ
jgi:hypothetical protein